MERRPKGFVQLLLCASIMTPPTYAEGCENVYRGILEVSIT